MPSKQSLEAGNAPFVEMQNMTRDAIEHILKPGMANKYRKGGFEIYWAGIARK